MKYLFSFYGRGGCWKCEFGVGYSSRLGEGYFFGVIMEGIGFLGDRGRMVREEGGKLGGVRVMEVEEERVLRKKGWWF